MCYCAQIKEMMELSKKGDEVVTKVVNEGTIFVKYSNPFDDYTLQYSWIINEDDGKTREEVQDVLGKYLPMESGDNQQLDVIQIGVVCVYNTNADELCDIIELSKKNESKYTRDTKYVFCGKKVLRVVQYCGEFFNPFDCIESITKWNDPSIKGKIKNQNLSNVMRGIHCYQPKETNGIIFSIGCGNRKTIFMEDISKIVPPLLYIDSFQGIIEHNIIK